MTSNRCPECGHTNRPGMLFCEDCGANLVGQDGVPTKKLPQQKDRRKGDYVSEAITLRIRDAAKSIVLQRADQIVLGRVDKTDTKERPDLDLTPYGAPDKGVSRLHAALRTIDSSVTVIDMGSSNGTFLNGQRLVPNQPQPIHDGDEIRLGRLVTNIYLK